MWTGRGRSEAKIENALATSSGTSSAAMAVALSAVRGAVTADWSVISCSSPHPLPRLSERVTAEIISTGMESA